MRAPEHSVVNGVAFCSAVDAIVFDVVAVLGGPAARVDPVARRRPERGGLQGREVTATSRSDGLHYQVRANAATTQAGILFSPQGPHPFLSHVARGVHKHVGDKSR